MNSFKKKSNLDEIITKINRLDKFLESINPKIIKTHSSIDLNINKINLLSEEKTKNSKIKSSGFGDLTLKQIEKDIKIEKESKLEKNPKIINLNLLTDSSGPKLVSKINLNKNNLPHAHSSRINAKKEFTQKIKYNSPVCEKCFRFVYISFDFIKNYISTICSYCEDISIYTYDKFLEKINGNNNPLLNSICQKCKKSFIFSQGNNPFYLIEKENKKFFIKCKNCLELDEDNEANENGNKIKCDELLEHFDKFYKNEEEEKYIMKKLLELRDEKSDKDIDRDIIKYLKEFENYKKHISIIEDILKNYNLPLSLRQKVEKKLFDVKYDIKIKNKIIDFYNEIKNSITIENIISMLHNILDFSNFKMLESMGILDGDHGKELKGNIEKEKSVDFDSSFKQINELISETKINRKIITKNLENFINCENFKIFENLRKPKKLFNYSLITKNYLTKDDYIKDNNKVIQLKFQQSYSNVVNINFETGKSIIYDILSTDCFSEKIVPIPYNYKKDNNKLQDILIYNYKNDRKIYYIEYDIKYKCINDNLVSEIINQPFDKILSVINLNNGEDLFIMGNIDENTYIYYINKFRGEKIKKLEKQITKIDEDYFELINNQNNICVKTKKNLFLINKNGIREINLPQEEIHYKLNMMYNNYNMMYNPMMMYNPNMMMYNPNMMNNNPMMMNNNPMMMNNNPMMMNNNPMMMNNNPMMMNNNPMMMNNNPMMLPNQPMMMPNQPMMMNNNPMMMPNQPMMMNNNPMMMNNNPMMMNNNPMMMNNNPMMMNNNPMMLPNQPMIMPNQPMNFNPMMNYNPNQMINNNNIYNPMMNNQMVNNPYIYNHHMVNNNMNIGMNPMNFVPLAMNPIHLHIFQNNEEGYKILYRKIISINDNYFIVLSTRHNKNNDNIDHYCYLSLFDFNLMEEINKIEICKITEYSNLKFDIEMKLVKNNINLIINTSIKHSYNYIFNENEIILE